ncbi:D-cysteine desulfhydrase family protein [Pseudemcibacter aquimaris]|uniref:D-cysteine desulfhydrase family protein n=1 Tax=Pseudemcibacter aquimaris TaxID=2857064 RepID=UPI0020114366|nr:D-cysteine desulfhydrase family protein [Pseudemcibacter aquimaris]MCC3859694.1 D-cysteine desulfhydrase family protein [Pseudemcibacter aquimaris]WDU60089.1 D-cysteine desulfhydrase family protein [Pseudemcibacter aquimaris]
MKFEEAQRLPLTSLPTSFYKMANLTKHLGGPDIYVKRDDVMDLAHGGNKTRKLEYVFANMLAQGYDTVITMGGIQSNHVRQTISGAARLGIESHAILNIPVPELKDELAASGNYLMDVIMDGKIHIVDGDDDACVQKMQDVKDALTADGKKPYLVPMGASDGVGSLGYMACAREMMIQWENMEINPSHIFVGTGSCGTHGGLLAGLRYFGNKSTKVVGVSVSQPEERKIADVKDILNQIHDVIELPDDLIADDDIIVKDAYYGKAYAYPTDEANDAVKLIAKLEGILLDPVYTGKTMAGMIDLIEKGELKDAKDMVFLHTGGAPALHPYAKYFL